MPAGQRARVARWAARRSPVASVPELLDGQVGLDLACLDRVYLNGYVPNLQVGGQVVTCLTRHLGSPIPSPALFNRIGEHFRAAVGAFAIGNEVPVVRFGKHDREADVMRPYLARAAATGRSQVAAIGISQEFQSWAAVLLGGAVGLWIGFDLIYALQDIDSDRATGGARGHGRAATGAPNRVFTGP